MILYRLGAAVIVDLTGDGGIAEAICDLPVSGGRSWQIKLSTNAPEFRNEPVVANEPEAVLVVQT